MKKLYSLLGLLFAAHSLSAEIIETNEIATVRSYATEKSLVLFNISDTLYIPATTLADNRWRIYFAERVNKTIADRAKAEAYINKIKNIIVNNIPKKAVEPETPQLIKELQNRKIAVLGITRKYLNAPYAENFGEITAKHLNSIGIDLNKTLEYLTIKGIAEGYSFKYGILFTNKKPEGPAILSLLKETERPFDKVVMVDNSAEALKSAETSLAPRGMQFIGLRYGRNDESAQHFDPDLGTIQFFEFMQTGKIFTDEQAKAMRNGSLDYGVLLQEYIRKNA